jgi:hypothetical protein
VSELNPYAVEMRPFRCTCDDCCKRDPSRMKLRRKKGYGVINNKKVHPITGETLKDQRR